MTTANPVKTVLFRFQGPLEALSDADKRALLERTLETDDTVANSVRRIIERVRRDGDDALRQMSTEFDGVTLESIEVPSSDIERALESIDEKLLSAMNRAARNIARVHQAFALAAVTIEVEAGVTVTRRPDALARVGIYAPGGSAAYASSVLMSAIPAQVAGVREIVLASPPRAGSLPAAEVLAAAAIAGVDRVFAVGGAGAIGAMAFGTQSIPAVDKITGPGNAYVAEAKSQVASRVAIDSPAGPSELLVIADESADPVVIAREVSAQAEHDVRAVVVVIAVGEGIAERITRAIAQDVEMQSRGAIIREALASRGGVISIATVDAAIEVSNAFAPEHLLIATANAEQVADSVRSAGSVFIGETSSVTFGDYMTGANHVLPTGGMGRFYSGLSTSDFVRWTTLQTVDRAAARRLSADTAVFARAEQLPAHALAADAWSAS